MTGKDKTTDNEKSYYVYVLRCSDHTLYTGYTTDVVARVKTHNEGKGAKYTRSRGPVSCVAQWTCPDLHAALSLEYRFKRLTRRRKDQILRQDLDYETLMDRYFPSKTEPSK